MTLPAPGCRAADRVVRRTVERAAPLPKIRQGLRLRVRVRPDQVALHDVGVSHRRRRRPHYGWPRINVACAGRGAADRVVRSDVETDAIVHMLAKAGAGWRRCRCSCPAPGLPTPCAEIKMPSKPLPEMTLRRPAGRAADRVVRRAARGVRATSHVMVRPPTFVPT